MHKQPTHSFYISLLEFVMAAKQQIFTVAGEYGLTGTQAMTLLMIDEARPRPMKNFCTIFHCDASNITGIVDGLESKNLVSRENDIHDRRIKVIKLEPAGRELKHTLLTHLESSDDFLFSPLSPEEKTQLIGIIEKLAAVSAEGDGSVS